MTRSEEAISSDDDESYRSSDSEQTNSGSDRGSGGGSGSGSDESSGRSASDSDGSGSDEEDDDEKADDSAAAKHKLVEADLTEIRHMLSEMDKVKMRLQFRLAQEREIAAGTAKSSSSVSGVMPRRASIEDVYVPHTVSAAAQTTWDMPRMYEVEKMVEAGVNAHSAGPQGVSGEMPLADAGCSARYEGSSLRVPESKTAQLSLQDLAKSMNPNQTTAPLEAPQSRRHQDAPLHSEEVRTPSTCAQSNRGDVELASRRGSEPGWANTFGRDSVSAAFSGRKDSIIEETSPHTSPSDTQERSFAALDKSLASHPAASHYVSASPQLASGAFQGNLHSSHTHERSEREKTTSEKEMDAIKSLLFF